MTKLYVKNSDNAALLQPTRHPDRRVWLLLYSDAGDTDKLISAAAAQSLREKLLAAGYEEQEVPDGAWFTFRQKLFRRRKSSGKVEGEG